ncbi:MAG TPA: MFS transporter [Arsenicitalea sp.]|jgi:predicted MFS family arabinose efflux permease|nr:MFS transporter [Arsenicitalea sp.]
MTIVQKRAFGQRYAFVVVAVIFLALLISSAMRSAPGVLMLPLQNAFGWGRDTISLSAAIGILIYGLAGPFAAALMERIGLRRTVLAALALMSASTASSLLMTQPWHLMATWGIVSGIATGAVAAVLGATIVNRWFTTNRGLVMGLMSASTATGTLIFLPAMAALAESGGWQKVVIAIAIAAALLIPLVYFLVPERPSSIGLTRYGAKPDEVPEPPKAAQRGFLTETFSILRNAATTRTFWFLFATFFICGFTTNGLIGTHLIAFCGDHGIPEVQAAGLLALMGVFDLIGTTFSGWLTDRFDPRKLLFVYYGIRGLSLLYLPYSGFSGVSLTIFAVFYGLDWIATVPPTLKLANEKFGDRSGPIVFGWILAGHQAGGATAAFFGGFMREWQGNYTMAFLLAGITGLVAAAIAMMINRQKAEPVLREKLA